MHRLDYRKAAVFSVCKTAITEDIVESICASVADQLTATLKVRGNGAIKAKSLEKLRRQIELAYSAIPLLPVTCSRPLPHLPTIASEALQYYLTEQAHQQ
jgi:hypothetical protein